MAKPHDGKPKGVTVVSVGVRRFPMAGREERANMAEDLERSMTGRGPMHGAWDDSDDSEGPEPGQHGSPIAGYMPPEDGPFRCSNCEHFSAGGATAGGAAPSGGDDQPGQCDEPHVIQDPQVRGRVKAGGCCNFFTPAAGPETAGAAMPMPPGAPAA